MAVRVSESDQFDFPPPMRLFAFNYFLSSQSPSCDVTSDGRLLVLKPPAGHTETAPPRFVVVQHWADELKRLVPTK